MRRLSDISIQVEDRPAPSRPRAADKAGASSRSRVEKTQKGESKAGERKEPAAAVVARPGRRWPSFLRKRSRRMALGAGLAVGLIALPLAYLHSSAGQQTVDLANHQMLDLSARAGFRIKDITVEGRRRTPAEELLAALQVQRGDPILGVDLSATRQRLEEISWVKSVVLERRLPGEMRLLITERSPIAIWQNQGHYYLVDREGLVVGDQVSDFPELPLVVGEGAPDHTGELLDMLHTEPELMARVKAAQWISGRRWNLRFDDAAAGIDARLPEEEPAAAWHQLAALETEQKILERKVALIDLRLPDRLVLRANGGAEESAAAARATARSTAGKRKLPGKDA